MSIIGIGNPGVGKSTILNAIAGECLFQTGISWGPGLTYELDIKERDGRTFIDTPGLADHSRRKVASEAISMALKKGGPYKILFITSTSSGRVIEEDVVTMKLILDAAPEIGRNFGIIVNMCSCRITESDNIIDFKTALFSQLKDEHIHDNILFLQNEDELVGKTDVIFDLHDFHGFPKALKDFVDSLPVVDLTPGLADDVKTDTEFFPYNEKIKRKRDNEIIEDTKRYNEKIEELELKITELKIKRQETLTLN